MVERRVKKRMNNERSGDKPTNPQGSGVRSTNSGVLKSGDRSANQHRSDDKSTNLSKTRLQQMPLQAGACERGEPCKNSRCPYRPVPANGVSPAANKETRQICKCIEHKGPATSRCEQRRAPKREEKQRRPPKRQDVNSEEHPREKRNSEDRPREHDELTKLCKHDELKVCSLLSNQC